MRPLLTILLALVLVPAALSGGPRAQTISGTISANSGASITVTSGDRSLTCLIRGDKAQTALARWGVGVKAAMACKRDGDRLLLTRLARLGSKEGTPKTAPPPTGTTTHQDGTTTREHDTTASPTTAPPTETRRDAHGKVSALGAASITVTRDAGTSLTCTVTDAQAREKGAPLGTPVVIVCAGDGDRPALLSLQLLETSTQPSTPTPPPTTTSPERRETRGIVTTLSSDGVTVRPDAGGDSLRCRITPAADSTSAAAKLSAGAHVGIVCRRDGDGYVLSGATLIS
jgi:hypothetical protein